MLCWIVLYCILRYCIEFYRVVLYCNLLFCVGLPCILLFCIALCCIGLDWIVLDYVVLRCVGLYRGVGLKWNLFKYYLRVPRDVTCASIRESMK